MTFDPLASSRPHSAHWGAFRGHEAGGTLVITPHPDDPDPSPLLRNIPDALRHPARIAQPMVRRGWLRDGPGASRLRGRDEFVAMEWKQVLDLLADELQRVYGTYGAASVYGGSYGWSSAGRFHHAQSQVHRFLNTAGGYVRSVNTYSAGAAAVILPHIFGGYEDVARQAALWPEIAENTDIVLAFGGMAAKNFMVGSGGASRHIIRDAMAAAQARGAEFVLVSPMRADLPAGLASTWVPLIPGTDTALMLGLAHTLVSEGRHDREFLDRCCTGYDVFEDYLLGRADGQPKDARWAAEITGVPADRIVALAGRLAGRRIMVSVSHSLQRAENGEQPVWMGAVLACMLGQIGLPGGGFGYSLGALANIGKPPVGVPLPTLPQGRNAVPDFIPVARVSDMLLQPGATFDYNGSRLRYPDIKLVYWAGGNPFHHHQDINRLRRAFCQPQTVVVHDIAWTATTRHADIVLPCTMSMERNDLGAAANDPFVIAMHQLVQPYAQARDDHEILADLAQRMGCRDRFTEDRSAAEWLEHLYEQTARAIRAQGGEAPGFAEFWRRGELALPLAGSVNPLCRLREAPSRHPLRTPSGKIEIYSATVAGFGYADCPGHPTWLPAAEGHETPVAAEFPLCLSANQPATRLHSQLDFGALSREGKIRGREPMQIHPDDAAARGIKDGDIVRLFNARGACLAAAVLTEDIMPGVVQLPTGAWYDPDDADSDAPLCVHGNPNVLTRDVGTSRLSQGCTGQLTRVEVERFDGNLPPIKAFDPPQPALA